MSKIRGDNHWIPWTVDLQTPLSTGFSRQEYWSGLSFSSPKDLPGPGIKPASPALAGRFFYHWATRGAHKTALAAFCGWEHTEYSCSQDGLWTTFARTTLGLLQISSHHLWLVASVFGMGIRVCRRRHHWDIETGTWHAVYSSPLICSQSRHSGSGSCGLRGESSVHSYIPGKWQANLDSWSHACLSSRPPCCSASELQSHDTPAQKWLPNMKSWVKDTLSNPGKPFCLGFLAEVMGWSELKALSSGSLQASSGLEVLRVQEGDFKTHPYPNDFPQKG